MAVNLFCYDCNLDIAAGKDLCGNCGLKALVKAGSILDSGSDEYTIDRILGQGGMGMTYIALNQAGDEVVVKQLFKDADPAVHAEDLRRFKREALIQGKLSHPRFPAGYGYFEQDGIHFLAMELIPGENVDSLLTTQGKLSQDLTLEIGIQVCEGLLVLHNYMDPTMQKPGFVHRDIKPGNLILKSNGEVVVLDLGIARPETQSAATQNRLTGSLGTTVYMALEQLMQNPVVASDQYSIAATLYHMVLGYTLPEPYPQRPAAVDHLPPNWQPIFRRALNDDETLRFPSVKEFQVELIKLLPAPLQAKYAALLPQQTALATTTAPAVSIRFVPSSPAMINPGEYREAIAGQVLLGNRGYAGARVAPFIVDVGGTGGARNGRPMIADQFGNFTLDISDVTVPVSVRRRNIEVVIQDPITATEVYRQGVTISKPWSAGATQFGAGFSHTMGSIGGAIASPFKAIGQAWHNRQLLKGQIAGAKAQAKAQRIAAKAQGYQAKQAAKAQAYQAKLARKQANAQAKAQAKAQRQAAKAAARAAKAAQGGSQPFPWWAIVLVIVFATGFVFGLWKPWPNLAVVSFVAALRAFRAGGFLQNGDELTFARVCAPFWSTLLLLLGFIFAATAK